MHNLKDQLFDKKRIQVIAAAQAGDQPMMQKTNARRGQRMRRLKLQPAVLTSPPPEFGADFIEPRRLEMNGCAGVFVAFLMLNSKRLPRIEEHGGVRITHERRAPDAFAVAATAHQLDGGDRSTGFRFGRVDHAAPARRKDSYPRSRPENPKVQSFAANDRHAAWTMRRRRCPPGIGAIHIPNAYHG